MNTICQGISSKALKILELKNFLYELRFYEEYFLQESCKNEIFQNILDI